MNSNTTTKDSSKTKPKRSFFRDLTCKQLLFACVYAVVTSVVGVSLMSVLYDVKVNFTYALILTAWFFLTIILFLYIKHNSKK
ncbi:hypothetical protein IX336_000650 [Porphyromonas levii]|nr:hypothetical protein [Porphyromonas levii]